MKIRSRGLGRRELEMDLREFTVERDGTGVLLKGVTHAPITWETTVWVGPRDVGTILRMAAHLAMLRLGLAWALHRPDVPGVDHAGERVGRSTAGDAGDGGVTATAAAASDPVPAARPNSAPPLAPSRASASAPAPGTTSTQPEGQPVRTRPERLVRAERPSRPLRPPRPPRAERPVHPDQRERRVVGAAGGPAARPAASAGSNGEED